MLILAEQYSFVVLTFRFINRLLYLNLMNTVVAELILQVLC